MYICDVTPPKLLPKSIKLEDDKQTSRAIEWAELARLGTLQRYRPVRLGLINKMVNILSLTSH